MVYLTGDTHAVFDRIGDFSEKADDTGKIYGLFLEIQVSIIF